MRHPIRRVRPEKTGIRAPLGDLELSVMRYVWACGDQGCQGVEVQSALAQERPIALTTVLTTLDRLMEKQILTRQREGKAYRYRALLSEDALQHRIVEGVLGELIAQFPRAVASYLVEQGICEPAMDPARLQDLAERIAALRASAESSEGGESG